MLNGVKLVLLFGAIVRAPTNSQTLIATKQLNPKLTFKPYKKAEVYLVSTQNNPRETDKNFKCFLHFILANILRSQQNKQKTRSVSFWFISIGNFQHYFQVR